MILIYPEILNNLKLPTFYISIKLTVSVAVLQFVGQPQDRLGAHLSAKVPVKGSGSATLSMSDQKHC